MESSWRPFLAPMTSNPSLWFMDPDYNVVHVIDNGDLAFYHGFSQLLWKKLHNIYFASDGGVCLWAWIVPMPKYMYWETRYPWKVGHEMLET